MSNETKEKIIPERDFSTELHVSSDGYTMPYRLHIPKDYDCGVLYPLLVFLHGAGERGTDNIKQAQVGIQHIFDDPESPAGNAIVFAPQCPEDKQWVYTSWAKGNYSVAAVTESRELQAVVEIIKDLVLEYNVDRDRIYVTGLSMGGFGTWDMLMRHPDIFAAGMPLCGGADPSQARALAEIPIRAFHGKLDGAVPVEGSRETCKAIKSYGRGMISYTEFEDEGHGIWDRVYSDTDNVKWLFSNVKNQPASTPISYKKVAKFAGIALGVIGAAVLLGKKKKK